MERLAEVLQGDFCLSDVIFQAGGKSSSIIKSNCSVIADFNQEAGAGPVKEMNSTIAGKKKKRTEPKHLPVPLVFLSLQF